MNFRGDTVATRQGREFERGKGRMAPTGKRRLQSRLSDVVGTDVSLYMMDSDQRDPCRKAQSLGGRDADEQGTHQTGTVGHGDGIHFLQLSAGLLQGLADDLRHALGVLSGGDLGHHAAVERVAAGLTRQATSIIHYTNSFQNSKKPQKRH